MKPLKEKIGEQVKGLDEKLLSHYRSNGTQLTFVEYQEDVVLGNTTMEDFAFQPSPTTKPEDWTGWTTSCHTCHAQARSYAPRFEPDSQVKRANFIPSTGPVGPIDPNVTANTLPLDFIWSIPDHAQNR
ncbi:MAG: hypothetical protein D3910_01225 [Candidatus Electrothrix sp. ATG2]|nr:hypothetical protein [Candidatus Electrothrix sp. ATG2]